MTEMKKRADWWKDIKLTIKNNSDYIAPGALGALGGGTLGYIASTLLWKNPQLAQKLLLTSIGTAIGAGTGVSIVLLVKRYRLNKYAQTVDKAKRVGGAAVNSILGDYPDKELQGKLSAMLNAMYGRTDTDSTGANVIGYIINQTKKGSGISTNNSAGQNIAGLSGNVGGGTIGWALTRGLGTNPLQLPVDARRIINDYIQNQASKSGPVIGGAELLEELNKKWRISGKSLNKLIDNKIFDPVHRQYLKTLFKGHKIRPAGFGLKSLNILGTLAGIYAGGRLTNWITDANKPYEQWRTK